MQRFPHEIIPPRTERAPHDDAAAREKTPGVVLYVGGESLRLTNLLLTHASSEVCLFPRTFALAATHSRGWPRSLRTTRQRKHAQGSLGEQIGC